MMSRGITGLIQIFHAELFQTSEGLLDWYYLIMK